MSLRQTKQQIVEMALLYFASHDYERSSLDEISRELGITKGAIYHYFNGKDQLFTASVQLLLDTMDSMLKGMFESGAPLEIVMRQMFQIEAMMDDIVEVTGIPAIMSNYGNFLYMMVTGIKKFPDLKVSMGDIYQGFIKNLSFELSRAIQRGEIKGDTDVEAVAFELTAFYEGALLLDAATDRISAAEIAPRVFEQIWNRISTDSGQENKETT